MKVVAFNGSPRKEGKTLTLIQYGGIHPCPCS